MTPEDNKKFARLYTIASLQEAQINANPLPIVKRLSDRIAELEIVIQDALILLSGADDLELVTKNEYLKQIPGPVEVCLERNRRAYDKLRKIHG